MLIYGKVTQKTLGFCNFWGNFLQKEVSKRVRGIAGSKKCFAKNLQPVQSVNDTGRKGRRYNENKESNEVFVSSSCGNHGMHDIHE